MQYINTGNHKRTFLAEILVRSIISKELLLPNSQIILKKDLYGKPYLEGYKDFFFNLSHSNQWIVCVIDVAPVGIDVEEIQPIDLDIAKKFFSLHEQYQLFWQPEDKKIPFFYDIWTMKEAVIKADGRGLYIPLNSFSVCVLEGIIIPEYKCQLERDDYLIEKYTLGTDYKLSVCAYHNKFPANLITLSFQECLEILSGKKNGYCL